MSTSTNYILIAVGALGAVLLASYIPQLVSPASASNSGTTVTVRTNDLSRISGIDLNALGICIEKGLI